MGMQRTAIRLAAYAALTDGGLNASGANAPTMAHAVLDSSRDAIQDVYDPALHNLIAIYTGDSNYDLARSNAVTGSREALNLLLSAVEHDNISQFRLERRLDLFEAQVIRALMNGATLWSALFLRFFEVKDIRIEPFRDENGALVYGMQWMTFDLTVRGSCFAASPVTIAPALPATTLPTPLEAIVSAIEAHGGGDAVTYAREIRADLTSWGGLMNHKPTVLQPFEGATLTFTQAGAAADAPVISARSKPA